MNKSGNFRYERKFIFESIDKKLITSLIKNHPANFKKAFPSRKVNNIYLDSPNFQSFDDNIEGLANRSKVRIRWYGKDIFNAKKPTLEFKTKRGLTGKKNSYNLKSFNIDKNFSKKKVINLIENTNVFDLDRDLLKSFNLSVMNNYDRDYLLSYDKRFRITLDENINFIAIKNKNNRFNEIYKIKSQIIMEIKYIDIYDKYCEQITNFFPFRLSKNSKYVEGLITINKFI